MGGWPPDLADGDEGGRVQGLALEPDPGEAAATAASQWRGGGEQKEQQTKDTHCTVWVTDAEDCIVLRLKSKYCSFNDDKQENAGSIELVG